VNGVPLSNEYMPSLAMKLSGSTSSRKLRIGHTAGNASPVLPSALHSSQAVSRKRT
jgi:hypothetical protein